MTLESSSSSTVTSLPPASRPRRSFAGLWWALRTILLKKTIEWQDRLGLYPYSLWIQAVEKPALTRARALPLPAAKSPVVCFLVAGGDFTRTGLLRTLQSLPLSATGSASIFLLLPDPYLAQESWLRDLLVEDSRLHVLPAWAWIETIDSLSGEWIVPLESGDTLAPEWMALFRRQLAQEPDVEIIYWDEDELSASGARSRPFLKPGWSPELLYSINYLETAAFRKDLLRWARQSALDRTAIDTVSSPGPAAGWILEAAFQARRVAHVPFLLQHRRPAGAEARRARLERHMQGVIAYLRRCGLEEVTAEISGGAVHVGWKSEQPLVSIIIPTRNNLGFLQHCLESLYKKTDYARYEIIVMDDHSSDSNVLAYYEKAQREHANLRVIANEQPFNWSRVNNHGARLANGDLLLFLNNDVEIISPGWLAEMARWAQLPGVGMVGARLIYPDESIQHAGIVTGLTGHAGHLYARHTPVIEGLFIPAGTCRNVSAVTGACMLVPRDVFLRIGGFNEDFLLVFNDVEIGQRVLANGQRVVYAPAATLIHYEGRSRARYIPSADIRLGAELLGEAVQRGDPYYNPNLSHAVPWPSLRRAIEPSPEKQLRKIVKYKG